MQANNFVSLKDVENAYKANHNRRPIMRSLSFFVKLV